MKKIISVLVSAAMLLTAVSCTKSNKDSSSGGSTIQTEQMSLKEANIEMTEDFSDIITLDRNASSGSVLIFGELKSGDWCGYVTDEGFAEHKEFRISIAEDETVLSASMLPHGKKAVLSWQDGMTRITVFGSNNEQESVIECEDVMDQPMTNARVYSDGEEGFIILLGDSFAAVSADGEYRGDISIGGLTVSGIVNNAEDSATCLLADMEGMYLAEIDSVQLSVTNKRSCGKSPASYSIMMLAGAGEYEFAAIFSDGLYGLKDGSWVCLCDFMDNTFTQYEIMGFAMTKENEFAALANTPGGVRLCLLTERDISEIAQVKTIKLAKVDAVSVPSGVIQRFNSSNDKYKVEVVNYAKSDYTADNINALQMDIISGNAPDIIHITGHMPIDSFGSGGGIFADLYELIDNDPEISRDDFIDGFLESMETNGRLLMMTPSFEISTVECKEKYLGGLTSWDYAQMLDIFDNRPEDIAISAHAKYMERRDAFLDLIPFYPFVDYKNAVCDFDSDTYIGLMKYFKESNIGDCDGSGWDSDSIRYEFMNDEIMLNVTQEWNFCQLSDVERNRFKEAATIIGYPSETGNSSYVEIDNGYAILANSDVKEGAWEFIKSSFLSEYYYKEIEFYMHFPVIDKYLVEQAKYDNELLAECKSEGEDREPLTNEKMEEYIAWVRESAKNVVKTDYTLDKIVYDEINDYFNDARSAEEAAALLQNRVSLYLSEQYQ